MVVIMVCQSLFFRRWFSRMFWGGSSLTVGDGVVFADLERWSALCGGVFADVGCWLLGVELVFAHVLRRSVVDNGEQVFFIEVGKLSKLDNSAREFFSLMS